MKIHKENYININKIRYRYQNRETEKLNKSIKSKTQK